MYEKDDLTTIALSHRQYAKRFFFSFAFFWSVATLAKYDPTDYPLAYFLTPDHMIFWRTLGLALVMASFAFYRLEIHRQFANSLIRAKGVRIAPHKAPPLTESTPPIMVSIRHGVFMGLGIGVPMGLLGLTVDGGSVSLVTASGRVLFTVIATMAWTIPAALLIRWMVARKITAADQRQ